MLKQKKEEITAEVFRQMLKEVLRGKTVLLDCGHHYTLHPFSNSMVISCKGETCCHNCY